MGMAHLQCYDVISFSQDSYVSLRFLVTVFDVILRTLEIFLDNYDINVFLHSHAHSNNFTSGHLYEISPIFLYHNLLADCFDLYFLDDKT